MEAGARCRFVRLEAAKHIAQLSRRADMDGTEVLAGEQAGHLFHRDRRIGWLAAGEVAQQPGEPRPAAHALSILARVSAVAAAIARDDRRAVGSGAKHRHAACGFGSFAGIPRPKPARASRTCTASRPAKIAP